MSRVLVFIPVDPEELAAIDGGVELVDRLAHRVTPELLTQLGYGPDQTEEAEYAALLLASVVSLAEHGRRTVLVAEVRPDLVAPGQDPGNGQCILARVPTSAITCWFEDEAGLDVGEAARAARGLHLDDAWELDEVQALLHGHDLLWNGVEEYRRR